MSSTETILAGHYDDRLVVLSMLIAFLGSYCTIELAGRVAKARAWTRMAWLIGGAIAMGIATWSMHYVGMLAFRLPVPVQYDWPTSLLAYLASLSASALGLLVASRREMGLGRALVSSIFMGGGIAALHYIAMESMRLRGMCHYSPGLVTLSVILAVVASLISLSFMLHFREQPIGQDWRKIPSALLLGIAIFTMHYTGMASVQFVSSVTPPDLTHAVSISTLGIVGIAVINALVLVVVIVTSVADRLQKEHALLDELFEQAPQAVALLDRDQRVVRVNTEFARVFGYDAREAMGRRIDELIGSDESRAEERNYADLVIRGQRVDAEGIGRRKDGSQLQVALVRVPVALPRGKTAIYAIYRDITASKQAAAAVKEANEQLHELSGRMLRMQDDEHRRIARELHDSIAQELVAVSMNLSELQKRIDGKDPMSDNIISDSIAILEQCNGEIRTISHLLHPALLDELGLTRALRHYVEGFAERSGIATTLDVAPQLGPLPRAVEATLFRVVQESLANVLRHSGSQTATVRLQPTDQGVELEIVDHGHGFPRALVTSDGAVAGLGVGILGMRERLRQFGGHLDLQSTATGAVVRAKVPLPRDSS